MKRPLFDIKSLLAEAPEERPGHARGYLESPQQGGAKGQPKELLQEMWVRGATILHFVNKGQWSMHELLIELLSWTGSADAYICSFAMSETAARTLAFLKEGGLIRRLTCIVDNRVDVRTAGSLQLLRGICDSLTLCDCHAKVTLLTGNNADFTVIGSANYTENKRYETGIISSERKVFEFHKKWILEAIDEHGQYQP